MQRVVATALLLIAVLSANAQTVNPKKPPLRSPDVIYVPTPPEVVDAMLTMAKVGKGDVIYDLGSGDGRIPITAVQKYGARRAVGIEIRQDLIKEAEANKANARVGNRVRFINADLFESDFRSATVITLFLGPHLNLKVMPKVLKEMRPGTRIVSHAFNIGRWQPEQKMEVSGRDIYLWRIPAKNTPEFAAAMDAVLNPPKDDDF